MLEQLLSQFIPGIIGAAGSGLPLYIALRKALADLRDSKAKLDVELDRQKADNTNAQKINTEAEWKRVIDEKNAELIRLRAKDDEQENKLTDLMNKHIECQKNEARNDEKLKNFGETTKEQTRQIKALTTKLLQLDKLVRGTNAPVSQGSSGTHESLLGLSSDPEEVAGSGPVEGVRASGSTTVLPVGKAEGSDAGRD